MSLSKTTIEIMQDMIENRLSEMVVTDREDAKEQFNLRKALQEIAEMSLAQEKTAKRRVARATPRLSPELLALNSAQFGY